MKIAAAPAKAGAWQVDPGFGVYVHIPFCLHRCHYCDFNTYEGLGSLHGPYVEALCAHIGSLTGDLPEATSVFFGGGTPTLLSPDSLGRILQAVRARTGIAPDAEVTVEANPETVDVGYLEGLLAAGFNRISIGVQSLVPHVLEGLGRTHPTEVALDALAAARRAGFEEINADLIYGSPWESARDWRATLDAIVQTDVDHVSAYALTIEEGTPLGTWVRTGRVSDVDPDVQADRYETARAALGAAGFERYEVSNWARRGRAGAHNVLYWSAGNYLGLGAGAHGHSDGRRYWSTRLPRDFIDAASSGAPVEAGCETLSAEQRALEALMLGLRLQSGIDEAGFARRFGDGALDAERRAVDELIEWELLERSDGHLRVAPDQLFRLDAILTHLAPQPSSP